VLSTRACSGSTASPSRSRTHSAGPDSVFRAVGEKWQSVPESLPRQSVPESLPRLSVPESLPRQSVPESLSRQSVPESLPVTLVSQCIRPNLTPRIRVSDLKCSPGAP
jgi:hypothetical protein